MKKIYVFLFLVALIKVAADAQVIYIDNSGVQASYDSTLFVKHSDAEIKYKSISANQITLLPSLFLDRYNLNSKYIMSLESEKLLQNFYLEAGISKSGHLLLNKELNLNDFYWGWESPSCQLRGHFLGHWLSAAAYLYAETKDMAVKAKADYIIDELALCQDANGGKWLGSFSEKYFELMAQNKPVWSPQYTVHKTLMGLLDIYLFADSQKALDILNNFGDWFYEWSQEQVKNNNPHAVYRGETGAMLELWAQLYEITNEDKYLTLMQNYGNPWTFQQLINGEDALSADHCNASIPWSHGSAKIYEISGNKYWKNVTEAFWKSAVVDRETFATGGQNAGEHWIAPGQIHKFLGENNQEHCTVYNMIRTADYLFRWNGDFSYADYIEKNIYNGILAQQHPETGMVAYFLPMAAGYTKGGEKGWGHPTMDFYCCHGTLVQAHVKYFENIYYEYDKGLVVSQYIPSKLNWEKDGEKVVVEQDFLGNSYNKEYDASRWNMKFKIETENPTNFAMKFRVPSWVKSKPIVKINDSKVEVQVSNGGFELVRDWNNDKVSIEFPVELYLEPLPGAKDMYAVMEGPIVLAGVIDNDIQLKGNPKKPLEWLVNEYDQEYKTVKWKQSHYRTVGQPANVKFKPLYEIADEKYTIYFNVKK